MPARKPKSGIKAQPAQHQISNYFTGAPHCKTLSWASNKHHALNPPCQRCSVYPRRIRSSTNWSHAPPLGVVAVGWGLAASRRHSCSSRSSCGLLLLCRSRSCRVCSARSWLRKKVSVCLLPVSAQTVIFNDNVAANKYFFIVNTLLYCMIVIQERPPNDYSIINYSTCVINHLKNP